MAGLRRRQAEARESFGRLRGRDGLDQHGQDPPRRGQAPRCGQAPRRAPAPSAPASAGDDEDIYERLPEGEGDAEDEHDSGNETEDGTAIPEEFLDESNPFYVKKKTEAESKPAYKDTSDAASDILKKMMERRRRPS